MKNWVIHFLALGVIALAVFMWGLDRRGDGRSWVPCEISESSAFCIARYALRDCVQGKLSKDEAKSGGAEYCFTLKGKEGVTFLYVSKVGGFVRRVAVSD